MKKSELRQMIREEIQMLTEKSPSKMDSKILGLVRKIKKHPDFEYVKKEPHVVARVKGKDVKRVFGIDLESLWKEAGADDTRVYGWVNKTGTKDVYTLGYQK